MSRYCDELGRVAARDARYSLEAYAFVLEALRLAHNRKARRMRRAERARGLKPRRGRSKAGGGAEASAHVSGRQVCHSVRRLALRNFGLMAPSVLEEWGVRSTSDVGEIVFNLIDSGDLDKTPHDRRSDFDDVFDFADAFNLAPAGGDSTTEDSDA